MSYGWLNPKTLRAQVPILQVLQARGIAGQLRRQGHRLVGVCPIHGGDNPAAFVVEPRRGWWFCFTRCQTGGDVIDLIQRLDRCSFRQALEALANHAPPSPKPRSLTTRLVDAKPPFRPFTRTVSLEPRAPFLQQKGIRPDTARAFDAGAYVRSQGFLANCVAVRLHDTAGAPMGYAGRRLRSSDIEQHGKWKFPPRLPKRQILFNYHRVHSAARDIGLVVVECPWGTMRLAQLQIPAVAILGTCLYPAQAHLLHRARRVVVMLDGDPAGRAAALRIHPLLASRTETHLVQLPEGLDPDDLTDAALSEACSALLS